MNLQTLCYTSRSGWSIDPFPALDSNQTLVLVFSAPEFIDFPEPIAALRKAYPTSHILGCSTAGEIFGTSLQDKSLSVAVVKFERTSLAVGSAVVHDSKDSFSAGRLIAERLKQPDLHGVFILSDGSQVNGSELVRGFNTVLPDTVCITGGLAGDGDRFKRTWVIHDGTPQSGIVAAVGFYGDRIEIGHGSQGGWDIFGLERTVTRSEGNVLYELDGKAALQLYKNYLGDLATGLPSTALLFPLALRASATDDKPIVRTVLAVDEASQSMTFAGDIPQGYRAQLMKANFERLIDGASQAAMMAQSAAAANSDTLCIAVSCVGRRLILGSRIEDELEATVKALPGKPHQVGFYSYGEISPSGGYCNLHNQTMTVTTIREAAV
ncbi:MAG TPA: FIST N-terminal domain-containing protein [Aggregatilineaceae bacterium]|nr:FIST N-terminal domain-containing protein [Aggregatilineaceae bacterium]